MVLTRALAGGLVVVALLTIPACGSPQSPVDATGEGSSAAAGGEVPARQLQIYSAVVHRVIEGDNTFGGAGEDVPFDHVLIDTTIGGERSGTGESEGCPRR